MWQQQNIMTSGSAMRDSSFGRGCDVDVSVCLTGYNGGDKGIANAGVGIPGVNQPTHLVPTNSFPSPRMRALGIRQ